jgi:hypothetical protein
MSCPYLDDEYKGCKVDGCECYVRDYEDCCRYRRAMIRDLHDRVTALELYAQSLKDRSI